MKIVSQSSVVLEALRLLSPGTSNRTLRQLLSRGCVRLNGAPVKIANQPVQAGDSLEITRQSVSQRKLHGLTILYEDDDLLVIHKPAGLLTVATLHEREQTAYAYLRQYVKLKNRNHKLFIVHRLDKFVSGLLVFAKSEEIKRHLQELFRKHDIERKYWAIVEGRVSKELGTIRSRLAEDRMSRMRSTKESAAGKHAVTHYRVLRRFPNLTTLEVTLETGRKNQIRVHLSELGHPIVGDRAYGSTMDPLGRMGLHAFCLGFEHPSRGTLVLHQTPPPPEFKRYLPGKNSA